MGYVLDVSFPNLTKPTDRRCLILIMILIRVCHELPLPTDPQASGEGQVAGSWWQGAVGPACKMSRHSAGLPGGAADARLGCSGDHGSGSCTVRLIRNSRDR